VKYGRLAIEVYLSFVGIKGYLQGKLYLLVVDIDAFLLFHKSALFNGNLRAIYGQFALKKALILRKKSLICV
jgi:hypothetical protein